MAKYTTADLDAVRREREAKGTYTSGRRADGEATVQAARMAALQNQLNAAAPPVFSNCGFFHNQLGVPPALFGGLAGGHVHTHTISPEGSFLSPDSAYQKALRERMQAQVQKEIATQVFKGLCPKCGRVHYVDGVCEKVGG